VESCRSLRIVPDDLFSPVTLIEIRTNVPEAALHLSEFEVRAALEHANRWSSLSSTFERSREPPASGVFPGRVRAGLRPRLMASICPGISVRGRLHRQDPEG
jgi:hypothetical protein